MKKILSTTCIASAHIVISGSSVVLCDGSELIDVLNGGQCVLNVLSLAGVKDDKKAADLLAYLKTFGPDGKAK